MAYQLERTPTTSWWDTNAVDSLARTVHKPEATFTGLINKDGKRIMRTMDQIGFVRNHDRPTQR